MMDLTPPGAPLEGHIYLNDPTGETITYYKSTGTSYSQKPGEDPKQFTTPEGLISYLATLPSAQKSANSLSVTEMGIIEDIAESYGLSSKIDYIGPKATGTPFMFIVDKHGQGRFTIRKLANKFFLYKIVYKPNVVIGTPESVVHQGDWDTLIKELHVQLSTLVQPTITVPSKDKNTLSQTEMMAIDKLAKKYMLGTTQPLVGPEQSPSMIIQGNMGSNIWLVRKFEAMYEILNIINNKNWEKLEMEPTFAEMLLKLKNLFEKYITKPQKPESEPQSTEHNGITPEEHKKIKEAVDTYGETFWAIYIEPSPGQTAYVEVVSKPDPNQSGTIIFSVGALGNYYQINDENNKPKENFQTFNGVIARIHDMLSAKAGQVEISPKTLDEITNLVNSAGFAFVGDPPEGDEPYSFGKGTEVIDVEQTGAVYYSNEGVMGPIYTKNPNVFIQWFKNTYLAGKVPDTAEKFADNILKLLNNAGFLVKTKFTIIPHEKVNAIKLLRQYIIQVTGGPCGLGKTKWAIENLSMFLDRIKTHGLPDMDGTAPDLPQQFADPKQHEGMSDKLAFHEQAEIAKIVSKHAPSITYQPTGDAIVIWVGNHITSYKVVKENDVYRVYTDKEGEWVIQNQVSTINELLAYLDDMLSHIAKALANSKLDQPLAMTEPSALFPDMLSPSEVAELKKLIKKFNLPVATSYDKKLMEAKEKPKENNAYSVIVADDPHKVYIKITKKDGKYVFAKGLADAYYPLKTFDAFSDLLYYTDFFFNSYIKAPEPVVIEKIPDGEVKMLKDLVKKYKVKGKVRRKYMTSKGQGKAPYVFIELDDVGMKDYAIAKSAKGVYKLFEVNNLFEEWKNVAVTDTWEGMYDIVSKVLNDEPLPADAEKYNPPVLDPDQFEWLETFMKTHKPQVVIKKFKNGVVGGYDPTNQVMGADNPLFIIRWEPGSHHTRILQVHTEDGGGKYDEYPFATFEGLTNFIPLNLEVITQLLKGEYAPESKLASVITKAGFEYADQKDVAQDHGGTKHGTIYENDKNERLYLYDDGMSRIWYKNHPDGETYKKEFANIPELVQWMEEHYQGKESVEAKDMQNYLASFGFKIEHGKSDKFCTLWVKTFGSEHQPGFDYVYLHSDGTSKVTPSPLIGHDASKAGAFFFNTLAALTLYLTEKYVNGENWANDYFKKVLEEGKFQKKDDTDTEMGYLYQSKTLFVVPFTSGGIMRTLLGVEPKLYFSFESTYDLAKRIELFSEGNTTPVDAEPSTGYSELDDLIEKAGFKFQGQEKTPDGEPKLIFLDAGGIKLTYYLDLEGSSIQFPAPTAIEQQGIGFTTVEDLIDHLKKYADKPSAAKGDKQYAKHYYDDLGDSEMAYSIRLTEEDDELMRQMGWVFIPSYKTNSVAAYYNTQGYRAVFYNRAVDSSKPVCDIFKPNIGGALHLQLTGTDLENPHKVVQYLQQYPNVVPGSGSKQTSTVTYGNESVMHYGIETNNLIDELSKIFQPPVVESIHFQYNSTADGAGEIRAITKNILQFAIGKKQNGAYLQWYVRQKVADNSQGLYMVYMFGEKDAMVEWIKENESELTSFKTIKGADGLSMGKPYEKPSEDKYVPSGETYKTHDIEGNADMIWLNKHDTELLSLMGFSPVPQENRYYKNLEGNIVKFFDTGKAEYIDYSGHPETGDGVAIPFGSISHALKFIVVKHSSFPFSKQNYKDDDGKNVYEIQLIPQDDAIMEQLGFVWDAENKKYLKFLGPDDKPKIQEAKKNDPPSPQEPDDFVNAQEPDEHHEVFTAYDTGNAIWQLMKEGTLGMDEELDRKEGSIPVILQFIWKRWQHELADTLKSAKGMPAEPPEKAKIPHVLPGIKGIEAPPDINGKFLSRGFIYDTILKGYHKPYEGLPGPFCTIVKWDGNTYYVSRPYKDSSGNMTQKEFASVDPYYVLNTILKIENAEFMDFVQSDEDALKKGDANYFNAPNGWKPYKPYSPKKNPNNVKPEHWIDKELGAYGFEWRPDYDMYFGVDPLGKIPTHWQMVRFDKNGIIVYFYHTKEGDPRYFCTKDFGQVQLRIEKNHLMGVSTGKPKKTYPLDPKNYPTAPDWDKNFSQPGNAIKLNDEDHKAVLAAGFKFFMPENIYKNPKTKDQFKIFSNGFVWYKLTGTGEGMDNIGHFFDMLKSKYGQLEWGFQTISGNEVVQITDKFEKMGFEKKPNMAAPDDMLFVRYAPTGDSKMNLKEVVMVFSNHSMTFYLYDNSTSPDRILGSYEFESLTYGLHTLENYGTQNIRLHIADDLSTALHHYGFEYVPQYNRYEHVMGGKGSKVVLIFFGNGIALIHLMVADKKSGETSEGYDIKKSKEFNSFYDALTWVSLSGSSISPTPQTPVDEKEVKKVMKDLGFTDNGVTVNGNLSFSTTMGKGITVGPKDGKVHYRFQYIADDKTGELKWGKTIFPKWSAFMDFVVWKTQAKPTVGELPFTPHPSTKELQKIPTSGQGPPIKGKIQGKVQAPTMPFSGFDYEGWAKGQPYNLKATIKLVPEDDMMLQKLNWAAVQSSDGVFYYTHHKTGDKVYFFVDGHTQIIPKDGSPITLPKIKMALAMLWAQHYEDKGAGLPQTPDIPIMPHDPKSKVGEEAEFVTAKMEELGFHIFGTPIKNEITYEKSTPKFHYLVGYKIAEKTMHFLKSDANITKTGQKLLEQWTLNVQVALATLENLFAFGNLGTVPSKKTKMKKAWKKAKILAGTEDMPWSGTDYKAVWAKLPPDKTLLLNAMDDDTISNMGWSRVMLGSGHVYRKGTEQIAFYKHGTANYWSNHKTGGVTQTFPTVEDVLRWLWKNKGSVQTPKVPLVYVSVPLPSIKEETLKTMGFHRLENNGVIWYEKTGEGQWVMFYKDGHATIKDKITGTEVEYFDTDDEAITYLKNKYFKTSKKKQKATGDMPYSGATYKVKDSHHFPITLNPYDEDVVKSMGFEWVKKAKGYFKKLSYTVDEEFEVFDDGTSQWRIWMKHDLNDPSSVSSPDATKFPSVKEGMQFLWKKYGTPINESIFKNFMKVWLM